MSTAGAGENDEGVVAGCVTAWKGYVQRAKAKKISSC